MNQQLTTMDSSSKKIKLSDGECRIAKHIDNGENQYLYTIEGIDGLNAVYESAIELVDVLFENMSFYNTDDLKKHPLAKKMLDVLIKSQKKMAFKAINNNLVSGLNGAVDIINSIALNSNLLSEKFRNKEVMIHLKNYEFSFNNIYKMKYIQENKSSLELDEFLEQHKSLKLIAIQSNITLESMNDAIEEIILIQKTKKLMQKTFSDSYRFLINDSTFTLMQEIVLSEINRSEFHNSFSKKIAAYKNSDDFNVALSLYIQKEKGWSLNKYIQDANEYGATIEYNEGSLLYLRINTYEQSKKLGSQQWCISYDEDYFNDYKSMGDSDLYFIYDFSKEISDIQSMVAVQKDMYGYVKSAAWKNDEEIDKNGFDINNMEMSNILDTCCNYSNLNVIPYIQYLNPKERIKQEVIERHFTSIEQDAEKIKELIDSGFITVVGVKLFQSFIGNYNDAEGDLKTLWKDNIIHIINNEKVEDLSDYIVRREIVDSRSEELFKTWISKIVELDTRLETTKKFIPFLIQYIIEANNNDYQFQFKVMKKENLHIENNFFKYLKNYNENDKECLERLKILKKIYQKQNKIKNNGI